MTTHTALSRPDADKVHASLQSEFLRSEHWATALKTLTLSLDEVVHIRSVLTKAELAGLPLDGDLKDDVSKGKVSGSLGAERRNCCHVMFRFRYASSA